MSSHRLTALQGKVRAQGDRGVREGAKEAAGIYWGREMRGKKHLPLHLPCDYQLMLRELFTDGLI